VIWNGFDAVIAVWNIDVNQNQSKWRKKMEQIFTVECYRYNDMPKDGIRLHKGRAKENIDNLSPCMKWVREFFAHTKKEAEQKGRAVARAMNCRFTK